MASSSLAQMSPVVTIKRSVRQPGQWQDFIEREQSSVDHLIKDSFAKLCNDLKENRTDVNTSSNFQLPQRHLRDNSLDRDRSVMGSLPRPRKALAGNRSAPGCSTLPRSEASYISQLPPGIEELEMLYAPMKNLSMPLPNARRHIGSTMPKPHPLVDWRAEIQIVEDFERRRPPDDDQVSEICSVMGEMPPIPAPVQSHALLEESLGHEIPFVHLPRTPMARPKFTGLDLNRAIGPPLPPRRTSSKLSLVSGPTRSQSVTRTRDPSCSIYANSSVNRTSLMSTGSSEGSSSSANSTPSTDITEANTTQITSVSDTTSFPWSSVTSWNCSPSPSSDPGKGSSSPSEHYATMSPRVSTIQNPYMNILYESLQHQHLLDADGSNASPYMDMSGGSEPRDQRTSLMMLITKNKKKCKSNTYDSVEMSPQRRSARKGSPSRERSSSASPAMSESKLIAQFQELMQEVEKKRLYRVGINIFNTKPELGIEYLAKKRFLELSALSVAKFLYNNESGLSKEKIGEYLGNLQNPFAMKVLGCFLQEFSFHDQRIDKSLRLLFERVRVSGEAQKIEKLMEEFGKHYGKCNPGFITKLKSPDSVVTLAYAVILLNTDLHTPNLRIEKRMSLDDFVSNLRGVDSGRDFDLKLLKSIYRAIKKREFVTGIDHVVQVQQLQQLIQPAGDKKVGINLAEPHRRLVCLCRLYEVPDIHSKKSPPPGAHQRDLLLFNDILVVTKPSQGSKQTNQSPLYLYRDSFSLKGLEVTLFHTPIYHYGIQVSRKVDGVVLLVLNAGSEHDRYKFVMDIQESIYEMNEMNKAMTELSD